MLPQEIENKWAQEFPKLDRDDYSNHDVEEMTSNLELARFAIEESQCFLGNQLFSISLNLGITDSKSLEKEYHSSKRLLSALLRKVYLLGKNNVIEF